MELTVRIRFTTPCIGNVRRNDYDRMQRDTDGNVIFMPTWWRSAFLQAAQSLNKYHDKIKQIRASLRVYGTLSRIKRRYGGAAHAYKIHEGYDVGAELEVNFLLPVGMTMEEFGELLEVTGEYVGVSPYGWADGYGHFDVLEVRRGGHRRDKEVGQRTADSTSAD